MDEVIDTLAPVVDGVAAEPASQVPQPEAQAPAEEQPTQPDKVESAAPTNTSPPETRKPSDYYKDRDRYKKRLDSLESTIQTLIEQNASIKKPSVPEERPKLKIDNDKFFTNPGEVIQEILDSEKKVWREEVRKELLETELPRLLSETNVKTELARRQQDSLELIFPKNGADDRRSIKERGNADPEKLKKLNELWTDTGMNLLWESSPEKAAANFLKLTKDLFPAKKNPNVINKSLVGSTATGRPNTGGKTMPTLSEIKSQLKTLDDQVDKNPDMRYDEGWKAQMGKLKTQLSELHKELGKNQ